MQPGYGRQSFLVVFDFDHTVCDCNTDEVIPAHLGRTALQKRIIVENNVLNANYGHDDASAAQVKAVQDRAAAEAEASKGGQRIQWTKLMDTLIAPFSKEELQEAAAKTVSVDPRIRDVFAFLSAVQEENSFFLQPKSAETEGPPSLIAPNYIEISIASDSNLLFIESALDATMPGVRERISQIHSNPYYSLESGETVPELTEEEKKDEAARDAKYNPDMTTRKSRLLWYERSGSGCEFCAVKGNKPNMCKSKIIKKLLHTTSLVDPTIIFVGDGGNDYCPVLNVLRPRDFVFVRRGFPLHKMLSTGRGGEQAQREGERRGGCCAIGLWQDAAELLSLFQAVMQALPFQRLPTLTRFLDLPGGKEFRAVTLRKRMLDIVQRTMRENEARMSAAGRAAIQALGESVASNGPVPPLPGQRVVPAWLRNYAFVAEHDYAAAVAGDAVEAEAGVGTLLARRARLRAAGPTGAGGAEAALPLRDRVRNVRVVPRWGQLPWLHGEVYFYHVLWQCMLMRDGGSAATIADGTAAAATGLVNFISPYEEINPLFSQKCEVANTQGIISAHDPAIPLQSLGGEFLVRDPRGTAAGTVARVVQFADAGEGKRAVAQSCVVPFTALTDPEGNGILGDSADVNSYFFPYYDIFQREKRDVLVNFIKARVVPMLATRPWVAPRKFCGTLLRWMLWGNGLDLSMFTVEQLAKEGEAAAEATAAAATANGAKDSEAPADPDGTADGQPHISEKLALLMWLREEEATATEAQDTNVVGNQVAPLAKYLRRLLSVPEGDMKPEDVRADRDWNPANYRVDVVMDNVGVECIADLCFGLWFLHHAEKKRDKVVAASGGAAGDAAKNTELRPRVTYHVKAQPYYVSDVTPRDFEEVLMLLEKSYTSEAAAKGEEGQPSSKRKKTGKARSAKGAKKPAEEKMARRLLKKVLAPFVRKVREAFASGAFCVDADTVWTQPNEYRELPPRLINRYFYTQTCAGLDDAGSSTTKNISSALTSRQAVFAANKAAVEAKTALVLFKGDLNFRRVVGDRYWEQSDYLTSIGGDDLRTAKAHYTEVEKAAVAELLKDTPAENVIDAPSFQEIVGAYWPVAQLPVACIRTIKSEGCVGVSGERKAALDAAPQGRAWRVSGKYGVILFAH